MEVFSFLSIIERLLSVPINLIRLGDSKYNVKIGQHSKLYHRYSLCNVSIGNYSYIGRNSYIDNTSIGNFCSISSNFTCGLGVHPLEGISTAPCFYSTKRQCGFTFAKRDKCLETKPVIIGNDVFIGANVTIISGVTIGDGAVLAAGSVVVKDVPPYAIVGGVPSKIIRYRFASNIIDDLLKIAWWNWDEELLPEVELLFESPSSFIEKFQVVK